MGKKRILIIDDEVVFTRILKYNLENTGTYVVRIENRGARGLAAALEFQPDLILLDIIMPDMDGGEVASQIKAHERVKHIPIVFFTAAVLKEEVDAKGGVIGGYPFIAKQVSVAAVLECIERYLGK